MPREAPRDSGLQIVYAVHAYRPAYRAGGPVHSVSTLAQRLVERGHAVEVFTSNQNLGQRLDVPTGVPCEVDGVRVWYFEPRRVLGRLSGPVSNLTRTSGYLFSRPMYLEIRSAVSGCDLVHTHIPFVFPTLGAAWAAHMARKPLFYHQRGVLDPRRLQFRSLKKRLYINAVEKSIMRSAACLFALTQAEADSYRRLGVRTPCTVVPNGVDVALFRAVPRQRWRDWDLDAGTTLLLFLGRLHPLKGPDRLLSAFSRVAHLFPDSALVLAGPDEWGMGDRLRSYAAQAGISDKVLVLGMVGGEERLDLLARSDLLCLPSVAEGFSMAVLEAMASSTAVLLSPGCNFSQVRDSGAGLEAGPDESSIARALVTMLSKPETLRAMGRRGRDLATRDYSWDSVTEAIEAEYYRSLRTYRGGPDSRDNRCSELVE